ncbi:hypothetical protein [Streptomyces sp. NPDC048277]|uniref:hypothetical protein n=1 Tax=Streptomyces sp. NPDC048277 TaxID=3155027 RepID=UPI0033D18A57
MPDMEAHGYSEQLTRPEFFMEAVKIWCDNPATNYRIPSGDDSVALQEYGGYVPLGALMDQLDVEKERGLRPNFMTPESLDRFEYHGFYMGKNDDGSLWLERADPRPTGWEDYITVELDERVAAAPDQRLGTEVFRSGTHPDFFDRTMTTLAGTGLSASNWQSLPQLREAFETHHIPRRTAKIYGRDMVMIDADKYETQMRQRDIAAAAVVPHTSDRRDSSSARRAGTSNVGNQRRRAR